MQPIRGRDPLRAVLNSDVGELLKGANREYCGSKTS